MVVTGDDVARGKPAPDIFLAAMRQSGVTADPRRCLVVEDSAAGVQAGIAAGMRVIAVPSVLDFIRATAIEPPSSWAQKKFELALRLEARCSAPASLRGFGPVPRRRRIIVDAAVFVKGREQRCRRSNFTAVAREGSRRQGVRSRVENARHSHGKSSAFCLGRGILLFLIRGASGIGHILRLGVSG